MKTKVSPFQSAQDNWPEDEASLTLDSLRNRLEDYSDDLPWCQAGFAKDVLHMRKCFMFEADGAELVKRYDAALLAGLANITGAQGFTLPA